MREEAESARSSKRRKVEVDDRLTNEKDPPPYGAQKRQDALWKGEQSCRDIRCDSTSRQEAIRRSLLSGNCMGWGVMYGIKITAC